MISPAYFTLFQCVWAVWWASLHRRIRSGRKYAIGRTAVGSDFLYRASNPLLFLMQNALCIASFWSVSPWLLRFHNNDALRVIGMTLFIGGSVLYSWAVQHLGSNYSPCYDRHMPLHLVQTGPYRWIRHPMYAAKILVGVATVVTSGSLWFLPTTIYFFGSTLTAMNSEDTELARTLPGYLEYRRGKGMLIPNGGRILAAKN